MGSVEPPKVTCEGLVLDLTKNLPAQVAMPKIPSFTFKDRERLDRGSKSTRAGFSIDIKFTITEWTPGQVLLQNHLPNGQGFSLRISHRQTVEIVLSDGRQENRWDTDPGTVVLGEEQHLTAIVDGGPRIIMFIVNGKLCDGINSRQFGWGRFSPNLLHVYGADSLQLSPDLELLRIYNRAIRVSEAVGNFRVGIE
ncbi:hypothetical protein KAH55_05010 [bacterium]|nr:hypothetical protein [bacterium]